METTLKIGSRVVWVREPPFPLESGQVKWKGVLEGEDFCGLEMDRTLPGWGSGWYQNHHLFVCKRGRGVLVAVNGLISERDYMSTTSGKMDKVVVSSKSLQRGGRTRSFDVQPSSHEKTEVVANSPKRVRWSANGGDGGGKSARPTKSREGGTSLNTTVVELSSSSEEEDSIFVLPFIHPPLKMDDAEKISGK